MQFSRGILLRRPAVGTAAGKVQLRCRFRSLRIETLEQRALLTVTAVFDHPVYPLVYSVGPPSGALTPAEIQSAYGIDALNADGGTGSGQTIAIIDAYNDPKIASDAATFNAQFGLQQFNVAGGPSLTVLNQTGGATLPTNASTYGWAVEESLDVEWAHAAAPQASIVVFEANSASFSDLMTAVQTAADYPGVSVVSMAWGAPEFSGETAYDSYFTTPAGHSGVTFLAATGISGAPGQYPAFSPNVVAVGGTTLTYSGGYDGETGWSGSGGGKSVYETEPAYQQEAQSSGTRETPDVSFDADPNTGVAAYDSYDYPGGWTELGGTGLSVSCWAGLIASANQLRAGQGAAPLNGSQQTLTGLYGLLQDCNDITTGNNGQYSAGVGYDMVTGLGTPWAQGLVEYLGWTYATPVQTQIATRVSATSITYGQAETLTATVSALDGATPTLGTVTFIDQATSTVLGTSALNSGVASITTRALSAGTHGILATYSGDGAIFLGSSGSLDGIITTVAGNGFQSYSGDGGPATAAQLCEPFSVAVDANGNLYIADSANNRIREVNISTGAITTVAGNGTAGYSGDGGLATNAEISFYGIAVDANGNLFIADSGNNRIREVNASTHVITTVAGNGTAGFSGDGGLATNASLQNPDDIAVDASGNLFISDIGNNRIREVNASTHVITTVAGDGTAGFSGDGGQATAAQIHLIPNGGGGIAVDTSGNLYIADAYNNRIREVNASTHVISTVVGNGGAGFGGDGGPATAARISAYGVAVDASGDLFVADTLNLRVREVSASTHLINTLAGNGSYGCSGDGGPAAAADLDIIYGIAVDGAGNVFVADPGDNHIREINGSTHVITTVAGGGPNENASATAVALSPYGVAMDASGDLFIADEANNVVREINATTGLITTVAGNGGGGYSGDGGLATAAQVPCPCAIALDASGDLFIADVNYSVVREVNASTHVITTVAGNGTSGFSGDGGQATSAQLYYPEGLAVDANGDLFIADTINNRIREVDAVTHVIATVAGNGTGSYGGDCGPATAAELDRPVGLAVDANGDLFIADSGNYCLREVNASSHIITTVAGIDDSGSVALDASGDLFVTDGNRVLEDSASTHLVNTVAGNGGYGYSGDGGLATSAELKMPLSIVPDANGDLYIADANNCRVRKVSQQTIYVAPAPLTVTASNESKTYGQTCSFAGTEFTATGLVNGDSVSSVTLASAGATASAAVGGYSIVPGAAVGSGLDNYTISYMPGELTVNPATLTVTADNKARIYGDPDPPFTACYSGFVNGDTLAESVSGSPSLASSDTPTSPAGTYSIVAAQGTLSAQNYTFAFVNGTLTVTQVVLTINSVETQESLEVPSYSEVAVGAGGDLTVNTPVALDSGGLVSVVQSGRVTAPGVDAPVDATGIDLDSGTFRASADFTTSSAFTIGAGGGTIDAGGHHLTLNGLLSGAGGLTVTGGAVTLGGTSGFGGGVTVSTGALIVASAATLTDGSNLTVGNVSFFTVSPAAASCEAEVKANMPAAAAAAAVSVPAVAAPAKVLPAEAVFSAGGAVPVLAPKSAGLAAFFADSPPFTGPVLALPQKSALQDADAVLTRQNPSPSDRNEFPAIQAIDAFFAEYPK